MSRTKHHGDRNKRKAYGRNWHWYQNYPRWWDKVFHTKPRRAATKRSLREAVDHPERDVLHPLDHKPHQYYY